jgi:hypothetical protein
MQNLNFKTLSQGNMSASSSAHDNLFDLDPLFASPANGAYQLSTGSPAVDAGDPSMLHEFFFDGDNDGFIRIDMGAFEYAPVEGNTAPVVDAGVDQTINLSDPVTINATYTDVDNTENHSARIDWGDGIIEDVSVTMTGPGAGEVTSEHAYSNAGNYIVEVCVTDLYGSVGCDTLTIEVNAFPSTPVLDDFNRANGAIGGNWSGNPPKYSISSNQLLVTSSNSNSDIYWSNQAFGADQEVYVTFANVKTTATEQDLILKSQSNTTWGNGMIEVVYEAPANRVQVWTWEWPQGWVQHGADIPVTFVNGDTFGARALANGSVEVYKNGTLLGTRDVTSWSYYAQGGYVGLWFIGANGARLDDFGGGTISTGTQSLTNSNQSQVNSTSADSFDAQVSGTSAYWQGIPLNETASVTIAQIQTNKQTLSPKPKSNGVWGEGVVQVFYDLANGRIQVWVYDSAKGWVQIGKDIPVKFSVGDQFTVRTFADGRLEILRNGKLFAKTDVTP